MRLLAGMVAPWLIGVQATSGFAADPQTIPFGGRVLGEAGMPIVGVKVVANGPNQSASAITDESGGYVISLPADANGRVTATLMAETDDGEIGIVLIDDIPRPSAFGIRGYAHTIELSPGRPLVVEVRDELNMLVKDADVAVLYRMRTLTSGRTDAAGIWRCRVPTSLKEWGVTARKAKFGFDYATTLLSTGPQQSREVVRSIPERLTLNLDGALAIKVRAVDQDGKPVAGIPVNPWLIKKVGHDTPIPLDESTATWPVTDATGTVTLDWLPKRLDISLQIRIKPGKDLYPVDHGNSLDPRKIPEEVTFTLLPFEKLAGRAVYADGSPAAGIPIIARGQGTGNNGFAAAVPTDAQGRYQFRAYSEQTYAVTVGGSEWAAPARTGVILRAGEPVTDVDFKLARATRLHGRITISGTTKAPKFGYVTAELQQTKAAEPDASGDPGRRTPAISVSATADAEGRYELFLGPGEYDVRGPREAEPFHLSIPAVNAPADIERNLVMPQADLGPFLARVVDAEGKQIRHAIVSAHYASSKAGRMLNGNRTNARGEMQFDRAMYPMVMHAQSEDKQRAGVARFAADLTEGKVVLHPVATATGQLTDQNGKAMVNQQLSYGIRMRLTDGSYHYSMDHFGAKITTDAEGRFRLYGLVVNELYHLVLHTNGGNRWELKEIKAEAPGMLDLGTVEVNRAQLVPVR